MPSLPDRTIDLNADLGEGPGEEPLYALITSANIACGGHAGDETTMRRAVRLALSHDVGIGAHPSYPDRERFGRETLSMSPGVLSRSIARQIESLMQVAAAEGGGVTHVKPHGALYNDAARAEIARTIAEGVASVSRELTLVGLAGSPALEIWKDLGFRVTAEGFADRAYAADGTLVPRTREGAVLTDPMAAAAQAVRLASEEGCRTICVHADTEGAAAIAAAVRLGLEDSGFILAAPAR